MGKVRSMTYAMTLDHSWEIMSEEEMYDVNGGNASDLALNLLVGIVGGIVANKIAPFVTLTNMKLALAYAGAAANVVWRAITTAVSWICNTPVALAAVSVAAGLAGTLFFQYARHRGWILMNKVKKISMFRPIFSAVIGATVVLTLQLELYVKLLIVFVSVIAFNKVFDMFLIKKD